MSMESIQAMFGSELDLFHCYQVGSCLRALSPEYQIVGSLTLFENIYNKAVPIRHALSQSYSLLIARDHQQDTVLSALRYFLSLRAFLSG